MEVARLNRSPWLAPFVPWLGAGEPHSGGRLDLARLNAMAASRQIALESGLPVRFVDAATVGPMPYELTIAQTGEVPTRVEGRGKVHDWFNALCWLRWPAIKARMNGLQAKTIREFPASLSGSRGALRDAVTLFDESGALFVCGDERTIARWHDFDWKGLFVAGREEFAARVRVLIVGHALLEKLQRPYKGICAQALAVEAPTGGGPVCLAPMLAPGAREDGSGPGSDELDRLDLAVAAALDAATLSRERLAPLPLLGIPGWWPDNADPAFYNDGSVFRPGRRRSFTR